jgi:hypothetical protein
MNMLEHPDITRTIRTGYPEGIHNLTNQPEHNGFDYFGKEILSGDDIVIDEEMGEVVLLDNLEKYLERVYGMRFTTAE